MKKIIIGSFLMAALSFMVTGCLKDKGFENNEYGINDPDTQPPGVGFSYGVNAKNDFGLDVSSSPQTIATLTNINMLTGITPKADVVISLTNSTTDLLAKYNTANSTSILPLPTSIYTLPTTLTIPAGTKFKDFPIVVSNTTALDPNKQYALGISIASLTGGYTISANMGKLFIVFSVKNQYDGKYTLKGQFYHPSGAPDYPRFTTTVELQTSGPDKVRMFWPSAGIFASPMFYGGALQYFGSQEPEIVVNQTTNKIVVNNSFAGATTLYDMGLGFNNAGYNSRWVPAEKTFYGCWGYGLGAGGTFAPNGAARMWIDTLIRTGPR